MNETKAGKSNSTEAVRNYSLLEADNQRINMLLEERVTYIEWRARMERWIFQLADKLELKLTYEK